MLATGHAHRHQDTSEKHNAALAEYNRQAALHLVLETAMPQ